MAVPPPLVSRENLLAWCVVPYDSKHRGPVERVAMLKRLGLTQYVWDWRPEHLKDLPEEIRLSKEAGLTLKLDTGALKQGYLHKIDLGGLRPKDGHRLLGDTAWYQAITFKLPRVEAGNGSRLGPDCCITGRFS